ncbi:MAG: flagellar biosynthetic protein FliP, partial [Desulfobulbaceae bacterium]|nr:flagellar biosynthetic protein FliP [Desulfobulbaceae bacterium]
MPVLLGLVAAAVLSLPSLCQAVTIPTVKIGLAEATSPKEVSTLVEILLIFTVLSMAPAILLMMTCFTRLVVAFGFLKQAMGTQQAPPSQVLIGLALFLTFFIMSPVFNK